MQNTKLPNTLTFDGRTLHASGQGRMPGSRLYIDHAAGNVHELHVAQVVSTGPHFSRVVIPENTHLGVLNVQHQRLQAGTLAQGRPCLVELDFRGNVSVVRSWALGNNGGPRRETGDVYAVTDKGYGFICPDGGGDSIFVHSRDCSTPSLLAYGAHVSYERRKGPKGYMAVNVKPA